VPQSPNHPITLLPYLALAFGILAVSMAAILVRWANAPATVMGFWRMFLASLVTLLPVVAYRRRSTHYALCNMPHVSRITLHASRFTPLSLAALAGVFFAFNLTAWNLGALTTTAANVTLLGNLSVVWVPLASLWLFKQRLRAAFWIGLICAMSGVVIILSQDLVAHPALGVGDGFGIAASIVYTGYLLTMERARANVSALVAWWISTTTSAVVLLMLCLALGAPLTGYPLASYAIFVTMALANQIGGFLSLNYALGYVPAPIVSTSLLAQPVLTALFAIPLLGQSLGLVQILGSVLVMTGIVIAHRARV